MNRLGTGAAWLDIDFQIGSARNLVFNFNADISSWSFEFYIKKNKGARLKELSLTSGAGISVPVYSDTSISIPLSGDNTKITEGEYYYELRRTDANMPLVNGRGYFAYDAIDGNYGEISLTIESNTINLALNMSIIDYTGLWKNQGSFTAATDAYPNSSAKAYWTYKSATGAIYNGNFVPGPILFVALVDNPGQNAANWAKLGTI